MKDFNCLNGSLEFATLSEAAFEYALDVVFQLPQWQFRVCYIGIGFNQDLLMFYFNCLNGSLEFATLEKANFPRAS